MKACVLALAIACASACYAQTNPLVTKPMCVILQHSQMTGIATWSRNYRPLEYVWGEFPEGMKFKSGLKDGDVRKIREKGGRVIVLPQPYTHDDLEAAKKSCEAGQ